MNDNLRTIMNKTALRKRTYPREKPHEFHISDTNGQVSLDFIAGTVIFMVTFFFMFQTLTNLFVPFQSNSDEIKSMADRVGITLAQSTAGLVDSPTKNNIISIRRATVLNNQMNTSSGYNDVLENLGLKSETNVYELNLSLYETDNTIYQYNNSVVLNNGPVPPQNVNVAQTIRIVHVEETKDTAILSVKVW